MTDEAEAESELKKEPKYCMISLAYARWGIPGIWTFPKAVNSGSKWSQAYRPMTRAAVSTLLKC